MSLLFLWRARGIIRALRGPVWVVLDSTTKRADLSDPTTRVVYAEPLKVSIDYD